MEFPNVFNSLIETLYWFLIVFSLKFIVFTTPIVGFIMTGNQKPHTETFKIAFEWKRIEFLGGSIEVWDEATFFLKMAGLLSKGILSACNDLHCSRFRSSSAATFASNSRVIGVNVKGRIGWRRHLIEYFSFFVSYQLATCFLSFLQ